MDDEERNEDEQSEFKEEPQIPSILVKPVNYENLGVDLAGRWTEIADAWITTGTALGDTDSDLVGSIENLESSVVGIEHSIGTISGGVVGAEIKELSVDLEQKIEDHIEPIRSELNSIKDEILPKLQDASKAIKEIEAFFQENALFLRSAVEVPGIVNVLKNEMESMQRRLSNVESDLSRAWDRRITIASVVIAIFSVAIAVISTAVAVYVAFFQ